jgi:hypothetical protein
MDFKPLMSPAPKAMPADIFQPKWGGLRAILDAKTKQLRADRAKQSG